MDKGASYAIAAYALVVGALVGYALHLFRERRSLRRQLGDAGEAPVETPSHDPQ